MSLPPVFSGFSGAQGVQGAPGQSGQTGGVGGSGAGGTGFSGSGGQGNAVYGWCVGGASGNLPNPSSSPCDASNFTPANPVNCLDGNVEVIREDGTASKLKNIAKGDIILGINCTGDIANQTVVNLAHIESECLRVSFADHVIICSKGHVFIGAGVVEVPAMSLKSGDSVLSTDGSLIEIISIEGIGIRPVVAIEVKPHHMFIADGIVHHNKTACAMRVEY